MGMTVTAKGAPSEPTEKRATADPARARVAAAIARLAADRPTDPAAALDAVPDRLQRL